MDTNIQNDQPAAVTAKLKRVNPFSSVASFASNICVDGQNQGEYVLLFVRQHLVILIFNILFYTLVLFFPQILRWILSYLDQNILGSYLGIESFWGTKWWLLINIGWFAYILTGYFNIFFRWFYNINILTTERFLDIDFLGIFETQIETATIKDIEDAKDTQNGLFQSIFNMGDITVLTASGGTIFNLNNVPMAHKVRDFIMDVKIKFDKERGADND